MLGGRAIRVAALAIVLAACGASERSDRGGNERGGSQTGGDSGTGGSGLAGTAGGGGSTNGGNAGSGAASANGGASGSSAGSGSTGRSLGEACLAYMGAYCRRTAECSGDTYTDPYPCSGVCPDAISAPGSMRTVDSVFACAEAYATWPCEDALANRPQPCATPGTRQIGETCKFSPQCESLTCKFTNSFCGICARNVGENEDCTAPDVECSPGFLCSDGVCRPNRGVMQPGEPCASFAECDQLDSFCNAQGICELYPGENQSCVARNHCRSEFYCAVADHVCRPAPGPNEACGSDAHTSVPSCRAGLLCTSTMSAVPGTCIEPTIVAIGGDCTASSTRCAEGATCACDDSVTCTQKHCGLTRLLGESCGDGNNACHPALVCMNGVCAPRPYQNTFETACGE